MDDTPPYPGLSSEYRRISEKLCEHNISPAAWKAWCGVHIQHNKTLFPWSRDWDDKLRFVDQFLYYKLLPENVAMHPQMPVHLRADLNKYRGWLLCAVMREICDKEVRPEKRAAKYSIPNEMSVIIEDLYLFHKYAKGETANIHQYRTLEELSALADSYLEYTITPEERARAHEQFLSYMAPSGADFIGLLDNGTEIISLKSEAASRAYGSPRWCTAYRHRVKTRFSDYVKDDCPLYIILGLDGQRWQISLLKGEWRNAKNKQLDLPRFLESQPGLDRFLLRDVTRALRQMGSLHLGQEAARLIDVAMCVPVWSNIPPNEMQRLLFKLAREKGDHHIDEVLEAARHSPPLKEQVTKHIRKALDIAIETSGGESRDSILEAAEKELDWHDAVYCDRPMGHFQNAAAAPNLG